MEVPGNWRLRGVATHAATDSKWETEDAQNERQSPARQSRSGHVKEVMRSTTAGGIRVAGSHRWSDWRAHLAHHVRVGLATDREVLRDDEYNRGQGYPRATHGGKTYGT